MHPTGSKSNRCCSHSSAHGPCNLEKLRVFQSSDSPGTSQAPSSPRLIVAVHVGSPTRVICRRAGQTFRGTLIHGDIDIIPSGTPSSWELKDKGSDLTFCMPSEFLAAVAQDLGLRPGQEHIKNRFQVRDAQIEHIAWALQAEVESGSPCGRLYVDSLAMALATQLLRKHGEFTRAGLPQGRHSLSKRQLKQVLEFIEENLGSDLSLDEIAATAGLSLSQCKLLFRQATGLPVHQYVIRCRVERAAWLLRQGKMPLCQIALEAGFAHQSHLALHMRRLLGASPKEFQRGSSAKNFPSS
jgi:AraC family transcriptional regulator